MARSAASRPDLISMMLGVTLLVAVLFAPLMAMQEAESGSPQIALKDGQMKPTSLAGLAFAAAARTA